MSAATQLQEYFDFMQWFQQNHPGFYTEYWQHITIPADNEGVGVYGTDLDAKIFDAIVQIEYDYYHPESQDKQYGPA